MEYLATDLAKKLDISRSYLYYLKDTCEINVRMNEQGRFVWDEEVFKILQEYIKKNKPKKKELGIVTECKTISINNRRYLGNKYKLIPLIQRVVNEECQRISTVADVFAGTGSVASAFSDKKIITNDNLYSNYICHLAWFSPENYSKEKIISIIQEYNTMVIEEDNYMSVNFGDTYFSKEDCRKIGFIREDIEVLYKDGLLNERERALLITSLLYAMDKIANTCGHYDAYRKGVSFDKHIELALPVPEERLNENNQCFNIDTNDLVKEIQVDLVYIDPPYNSRQYCDAYHLLENVARWKKPEVYGVAKKMDRDELKSDYCTRNAVKAFEELIDSISARYILLSYNNMAKKGNDRSNAKISDEDIFRILKKKGKVKVFSEEYKAFTTGKSDIKGNEERLFLCICEDYAKEIIPSALNYTGGKFKLLPQILPLFPKGVDQVVDLFCGGCNVGINLDCNKVLFNDVDSNLIGLLNTIKVFPKEDIITGIQRIISEYELSMTSENGYEYYECNSSSGLAKYNRGRYNKLRDDFNKKKERDSEYYLMLYVLIVYAYNNQLRFNKKGKFNLPIGKRDFNSKMQDKLNCFIDRLKSGDYIFTCTDFDKIDLSKLTENSFLYADPPYLITCASYNEQGGWTEDDEHKLLLLLDELNERGIKFALSNVLESKGKTNNILKEWVQSRTDYKMIDLNYTYNNSSYQRKNKEKATKEILVINY